MPFQPINFANIAPIGKPWARNFADNLRQGFEMGNLPQKLMGEREQQALMNALQRENVQQQQAQTPYAAQNAQSNASILQNTAQNAPRMSQAQYEHLQAQAMKDKALGAIGGMQFPGGMGLVQGEEAARRMWGENDPRTLRAIENNDALINQRRTGISKLHNEIDNLKYENNNPNITPQKYAENERKINQLENDAFNKQSDLDVRQKGLGANLMEQTWDTFIKGPSMKALKNYTGLGGTIQFGKDLTAYNLLGKKSKNFDDYLAAKNQLYVLSDQYMKAFPGSTNYQRMQSVHDHMDPSGPMMPPGALEASIKSTWEVIKPELETYKNVLHGKNPLREGGGAHNETIKELNQKTLKQQQEAARKATGVQPKKNAAPTGKNLFWDGSKFVEGGFPK